MHVHLDHARVGRHRERTQAWIVRRRVAFDPHGPAERLGDVLDRGDEVDPVFDVGHRRQEEMQPSAARFDAERRPHHFARPGRGLRPRVLLLLGADVGVVEVVARFERVAGELRLDLVGQPLRQGGERQAVTGRRIAREQEETFAPQRPGRALPLGMPGRRRHRPAGGLRPGRRGTKRQHVCGGCVHAAFQAAPQARAVVVVLERNLRPVDVLRQAALDLQERERILVGGNRVALVEPELVGERARKSLGVLDLRRGGRRPAVGRGFAGDEIGVPPQRPPVAPPVQAERPPRHRLARIPLALAVEEHAARGEPVAQPPGERFCELPFLRRERGEIPLRAFHVVDRDERRLAALGQARAARRQVPVDGAPEGVDLRPLRIRVRLGDARILVDAGHLHLEDELGIADVGETGDRRGTRREGGRGERDVSFAGEHSGRGIEADPARAGKVDLGPGVEIGEVGSGAGRTVERFHVGHELH